MAQHAPTRREAIRYSILCSLLALPCGGARAAPAESSSWYAVHRDTLRSAFAGILAGAAPRWRATFGAEKAGAMARRATAAFDAQLPHFPDVGGARNWDTQFIPVAGWYVALYAALKPEGGSAEDVGRLVYELNRAEMEALPAEQKDAEQAATFSPEGLAEKRDWAAWTQKRELPANWVATFVPGDGQSFDFGYDYSACGVVKYLRAQGVPELAPYVCLNDFLSSAAYGTGLHRAHTLAQGDALCDFRYRKNRPVTQSWDSEIAAIRARQRG